MFDKKKTLSYRIRPALTVPEIGGKAYYGHHILIIYLDEQQVLSTPFNAHDYIVEDYDEEDGTLDHTFDDDALLKKYLGPLADMLCKQFNIDIVCMERHIEVGNRREAEQIYGVRQMNVMMNMLNDFVNVVPDTDDELQNRLNFAKSGVQSIIDYQTQKAIALVEKEKDEFVRKRVQTATT